MSQLKNKFNVSPSQKEINLFVEAARHNYIDGIKKFLGQYPHAVNAHEDNLGMTALMWAAWIGESRTLLELLLKNGADIEARDKHGKTALMWAGGSGDEDTVRFLLRNGADRGASDDAGCVAEDYAAAEGDEVLADLLKDPPEKKRQRLEEQKKQELQGELDDFSPALKRDIPAPRRFKIPRPAR